MASQRMVNIESKSFYLILLSSISLGLTTFFIYKLARKPIYFVLEDISGGPFYPENKQELAAVTSRLLLPSKIPKILVVPHAGYEFSGRIAAKAFKILKDYQNISKVFLIGPSHFATTQGVCFPSKQAWRNEIGLIKINLESIKNIQSKFEPSKLLPEETFNNEHSIKVQLPFLQSMLNNFEIVPILINDNNLSIQLAKAILDEIKDDDNSIVIISTDLTHYKPEEIAVKNDYDLIQFLFDQEFENFEMDLRHLACGYAALYSGLFLANLLGYHFEQIDYGTSGDSFLGNKKNVVSYMSGMFFKRNLTDFHKKLLITTASKVIADTIVEREVDYSSDKVYDSILLEPAEIFVTIKVKKELRGCLGNLGKPLPLLQAVIQQTKDTVLNDSRFKNKKILKTELDDLSVSISIINKKVEILNPHISIEVGKHGIILQNEDKKALFLPKVATENNWGLETTLQHLCVKAGLLPNTWTQESTKFWVFTTTDIDMS